MYSNFLPIRRAAHLVRVALLLTLTLTGSALADHRIVSTDGITTEILFALGAGDAVVARDSGSLYPQAASELPDVGLGHQINPESILRFKPTVVIGRARPMSQPAFQVLESAGMNILRLDADPGIDVARKNIRQLAAYLGKKDAGEALISTIDTDLNSLAEKMAKQKEDDAPKILVIYLRPNATLLMGEDSNATALAHLAGATSALPGIMGYKPLNAEAVVSARPDIILCYKNGLKSVGGMDTLFKQPGISETPAARNKRVIVMDDLLLGGFGPRTGQALLELNHALFDVEGPYTGK